MIKRLKGKIKEGWEFSIWISDRGIIVQGGRPGRDPQLDWEFDVQDPTSVNRAIKLALEEVERLEGTPAHHTRKD